MKCKRILFTSPNVAEVVEDNIPGNGEVTVKLCVSSISSGTERANLVGSRSVSVSEKEAEKAEFPRVGGYSSAGIVEEVTGDADGIKVGDRVAVAWGVHSQYVKSAKANVFPIDDVPFEDAALFNIATFPLAAIRKCRLEIGESAIVMGLGVLGLVALQLLKAAGAVPIIAVDPSKEKREKALKCGADFAFDPFAPDFAAQVKQVTEGGANVGIEVTGVGAGLDGILDCMARAGRVALLGCTRSSDFSIDYYRKVHGPGITLVGAHTNARPLYESRDGWWTQRDDMRTLKRLTQTGRIKLSSLVDETHSFLEAPEIYTRLANDTVFPIVQYDWR